MTEEIKDTRKFEPTSTFLLVRNLPADVTPETVARWFTEFGVPLKPEDVSVRTYPHVNASTAMIAVSRSFIAGAVQNIIGDVQIAGRTPCVMSPFSRKPISMKNADNRKAGGR